MAINIDKTKYFGNLFYSNVSPSGSTISVKLPNEMCLIIVAAEMRGYQWEIIPGTFVTQISNENKNIFFYQSKLPTQPFISQRLCLDKYSTKVFLKRAGIKTPSGFVVGEKMETHELISVFDSLSKPLVVKPLHGTEGASVSMNIENTEDYLNAVHQARISNAYDKNSDVLVEEQIFSNNEYRLIVLDGKLLSCLQKTPFFVVGDGKQTIAQLVQQANKDPLRNISSTLYPLVELDSTMSASLSKLGFTSETVLENGETVRLRDLSNIMAGGFAENLDLKVNPALDNLAKKIMQAIPGLQYCGIDIVINDLYDCADYSVIEINSAPSFDMNEIPQIGESAAIADAILDYLFSEVRLSP
ncbi:hypothetical protein KBD81_04275 [Candidatus Woesebacteria bacterium]|nr:hypothetical protein [Candidatus Woesebacteria bacterium]